MALTASAWLVIGPFVFEIVVGYQVHSPSRGVIVTSVNSKVGVVGKNCEGADCQTFIFVGTMFIAIKVGPHRSRGWAALCA